MAGAETTAASLGDTKTLARASGTVAPEGADSSRSKYSPGSAVASFVRSIVMVLVTSPGRKLTVWVGMAV
jgi:hypothetical protein